MGTITTLAVLLSVYHSKTSPLLQARCRLLLVAVVKSRVTVKINKPTRSHHRFYLPATYLPSTRYLGYSISLLTNLKESLYSCFNPPKANLPFESVISLRSYPVTSLTLDLPLSIDVRIPP